MFRKLLLALSIAFIIQSLVFAQQSDSAVIQTENSDSTEVSFWKKHKVNLAAVPMINYDPSFELNMAALVNAFFRVSLTDTISPLSMAGAIVGYTTNKTWYWALYAKLYLNKDNYRVTIGYGDASVNFQYYDDIGGDFIDYNSLHDLFFFEMQRRVYKRWYLGLKYVHQITQTKHDIPDLTDDPEKKNMSNLGFVVSHDTRDFIYNPLHGDYMNFKTGHYREAWGSEHIFNKYEFDFTKFFNISDYKVVAGRITALIATGDVPFEGQYVVGREDIRGYTDGKHRANQVYDIQGEYRWNFYKKWGMVAFGGVATAVDSPSEISWSDLLPAVGVGLRFMAIPSEKINIGVDVAVGKEDWGIYFRIGEVFGDK
jgi:outer membrane protein assembly factor BamA